VIRQTGSADQLQINVTGTASNDGQLWLQAAGGTVILTTNGDPRGAAASRRCGADAQRRYPAGAPDRADTRRDEQKCRAGHRAP
jgi:hypothetical protein